MEQFFTGIGGYILGLIFVASGSAADIYTSTKFKQYGLTEGNRMFGGIFQNPDRTMNLRNALIAAIGFVILQFVFHFWVANLFNETSQIRIFFKVLGNAFCTLFGLYRLVQGGVNWLMIRKKQRQLKAQATPKM